MEGKASFSFSSSPCAPPFPSLTHGLEFHGPGSMPPGLRTLLIKCVFLDQVACIWC